MCSECAVARATRQLHNPRFSGPGAFKPEKSYNSLCEDIITKANIDWYLTAPLELRQCIVDDEEVRKDIEAGKVKISVDRGSGKPFIRSLRDPMTIAALSHMKMYVSAGLLRTDLTSDEIEKADLVSSEMGIGFISKEQVPIEEEEVDEKCDSDESFHPLPRGADPDLYPQKTYWLFLKDGVWTAWRGMPITMASWKREFITWKNVHPILSKVLDVTIVLTSMIIVYLAYTASYDMVASWLRPWWRRFTEEDVELEGRGMKNRHVARAEGKGNFKSRAIPVAEQYQRGPRQEESVDDFNIPREKTKNYIFYDIQDITKQIELGGLIMVNSRNEEVPVKTRVDYDRLLSLGYRVKSASLTTAFGLELPLAEYRNNRADYDAVLKLIHWALIAQKHGRSTKLHMNDATYETYRKLVQSTGVKPKVDAVVKMLRQNLEKKVTPVQAEVETFREWLNKEVSSGEVLESNIQRIKDLRCPNVVNGHPCNIKNCPRCAISRSVEGVASQASEIVQEALLSPEQKPILLDCVYKLMVRVGENWVKQGTAFAGP